MKIKAYFLFPDTDDDFVRIGENAQAYTNLIGEVAVIKKQLKDHNDFELCYDSENVNTFLNKAETLIGGSYLSECRSQLQIIFGNNTRNVSTTALRKNDCVYVHWNISSVYENAKAIIAEASEAKHNEGTDNTVVINIAEAYINNREEIHVVKDALHLNDLPILVSIPTVNNEIEFSQWVTTLGTPDFSLTDKTRFERTNQKHVKQRIYKEITTGNYWYYDFFHDTNKKHFEVFNGQGVHLGEANTNGTLDETKADNQKRITP
jgi:hypothetical protein